MSQLWRRRSARRRSSLREAQAAAMRQCRPACRPAPGHAWYMAHTHIHIQYTVHVTYTVYMVSPNVDLCVCHAPNCMVYGIRSARCWSSSPSEAGHLAFRTHGPHRISRSGSVVGCSLPSLLPPSDRGEILSEKDIPSRLYVSSTGTSITVCACPQPQPHPQP